MEARSWQKLGRSVLAAESVTALPRQFQITNFQFQI
jgi:hypothetical protein